MKKFLKKFFLFVFTPDPDNPNWEVPYFCINLLILLTVFFVYFIAIESFPYGAFFLLWGILVVYGHLQYYFSKKEDRYPKSEYFLIYSWIPITLPTLVASILLIMLGGVIAGIIVGIQYLFEFYLKQLNKFLKL